MPSEEAPFGASAIGPSRRQVLAGAGLLAAAGAAELVPLGGVEGWTPREDTWPLARYDLSNVASTDATLPADPSVAWTHEDLPSGRLALRDGTLYSAVADEVLGIGFDLVTLDPTTGERGWQAGLPFEATSLRVADGGVFVGYDGGAAGFAADTGWRRWRRAGNASGTYLALHGGDRYATEGLGSSAGSRAVTCWTYRSGPDVRWESGPPATDAVGPPAVSGARVLAGQRAHGGPGVVACHRDSGTVAWTTVGDADGEIGATGPAVADSVAVAGLLYGRPRDVERGGVVAPDTEDGSVGWTVALGNRYATDVAVAGDLVLVGLSGTGPVADPVRAFDLEAGTERWRVALPDGVAAVAPVEGTAFVACRAGSVHALRD